jgi:hypothetical protein
MTALQSFNYYYDDQQPQMSQTNMYQPQNSQTNMYQPDLVPIYYSYIPSSTDLSQNNVMYAEDPQYDIIDIGNNSNNSDDNNSDDTRVLEAWNKITAIFFGMIALAGMVYIVYRYISI